MRRSLPVRALAFFAVLSACGPQTRWIIVDVTSAGAPVPGATVSAACAPDSSDAQRSDADGVATLAIRYKPKACTITAAQDELRTVQQGAVVPCRDRATCAHVRLDLERP